MQQQIKLGLPTINVVGAFIRANLAQAKSVGPFSISTLIMQRCEGPMTLQIMQRCFVSQCLILLQYN